MGRSVYRKILVWVAIIAAAALLILFARKGINHRYFFYEGRTILRSSEEIDLRDMELTLEQYEQLKAELPGCTIRWMIPIGDSIYDSAATVLRISSLEAEHIPMYMYFDDLQRIYAEDCGVAGDPGKRHIRVLSGFAQPSGPCTGKTADEERLWRCDFLRAGH